MASTDTTIEVCPDCVRELSDPGAHGTSTTLMRATVEHHDHARRAAGPSVDIEAPLLGDGAELGAQASRRTAG